MSIEFIINSIPVFMAIIGLAIRIEYRITKLETKFDYFEILYNRILEDKKK